MKAYMTTMVTRDWRNVRRSLGPWPRVRLLATSALALSLGAPASGSTLDMFASGDEVGMIGGTSQTEFHDEDTTFIDGLNPDSPGGEKVGILRLINGAPFPPGIRDPLISAAAQEDGTYGAGVSAGYLDPGHLSAEAALTYTYRNDGRNAEVYEHKFDIPVQSVGLSGYPSAHEDLRAYSKIQILATAFDRNGVVTSGDHAIPSYSIELRKVPNPLNWTTEFFLSPDLVDALDAFGLEAEQEKYHNILPVGSTWVSTFSVPAYSVRLTSSPIQPGGSLLLELVASAEVNVGLYGGEQGGEAFALNFDSYSGK